MLITLAEMKAHLGIAVDDTSQDTFLTEQIILVSQVIEAYCRRKFAVTNYVQTFYTDSQSLARGIMLFAYPIVEMSGITNDDVDVEETDYRVHKMTGRILPTSAGLFTGSAVAVTYSAGFETIPAPVLSVVKSLVEERYNKKTSGISLNFGSDIQSISIPGAIAVNFDYSLSNNDRKSAFGVILGSSANILDYYRSERAILPSDRLEYTEEV